ncbi:MAG: hypothetical protein Q9171_006988 [Xanthocarpia ochracea]
MGSISIYAELLLNIRQITVLASLPTASCKNTTRFTLSQDRQTLSVLHDGQVMAVTLPAPVRAGYIPAVLPGSAMVLSIRLPIMDKVAETLLSENHTNPAKSLWSAISMAPTARIACRICQTLLVTEQVKVWKDLPSENWAEMMDFWHCHKPDTDEPSTHKQDGMRKGYGAASSIRPVSATGLIDITSFLLMQEDCNIIVSEDSTTLKNEKRQYSVNCPSCKQPVGVTADSDARIYKWNVCLQSNSRGGWEEYSAQKLISAQLLAMIESQGTQKFVIRSEIRESNTEALLIWIFTPNMYFSSTLIPKNPKQVMKIYHKIVQNPEELLEQQSLNIDELQLPIEVFQALHSDIKSSTELLPVPARKFQDWNVGLLER